MTMANAAPPPSWYDVSIESVRRLREKLPPLGDALVTIKQFGYKLLDVPPADQ